MTANNPNLMDNTVLQDKVLETVETFELVARANGNGVKYRSNLKHVMRFILATRGRYELRTERFWLLLTHKVNKFIPSRDLAVVSITLDGTFAGLIVITYFDEADRALISNLSQKIIETLGIDPETSSINLDKGVNPFFSK